MGGAKRGGTAEPTSRDPNTRHGRVHGKGHNRKSQREEENTSAQTEAARQSRAAPPATSKTRNRGRARVREITVATHNVRTWRWMGRKGLDGR